MREVSQIIRISGCQCSSCKCSCEASGTLYHGQATLSEGPAVVFDVQEWYNLKAATEQQIKDANKRGAAAQRELDACCDSKDRLIDKLDKSYGRVEQLESDVEYLNAQLNAVRERNEQLIRREDYLDRVIQHADAVQGNLEEQVRLAEAYAALMEEKTALESSER